MRDFDTSPGTGIYVVPQFKYLHNRIPLLFAIHMV